MDSGPASQPAPQERLYNPTNIQLWVDLFTMDTHAPSPFRHNNPLNLTQRTQNKCLRAHSTVQAAAWPVFIFDAVS